MLTAGTVYAIVPYTAGSSVAMTVTSITYTPTNTKAVITTTGSAEYTTVTVDNTSSSVLDKLTYTATLEYLMSNYTIKSQGFVFVNFNNDTDDYDTIASTSTTKVIQEVTESGKTLDKAGEQFRFIINNISKLNNITANSKLEVVAVPYVTFDDTDSTTVWGDPCLPSEVLGYTDSSSTTTEG